MREIKTGQEYWIKAKVVDADKGKTSLHYKLEFFDEEIWVNDKYLATARPIIDGEFQMGDRVKTPLRSRGIIVGKRTDGIWIIELENETKLLTVHASNLTLIPPPEAELATILESGKPQSEIIEQIMKWRDGK